MSFTGMDAGAERPLDPDLAKALSHPLRQRILERLSAGGEASPNELARELDAPLSNVAYHVRILRRFNCVELARTRQRRGALEHYYRAIAHPWFDAEQWARLPASFRRQALAGTLRSIVTDASEAATAGGFDDPAAQVRRISMELDEQSWQHVAAVLEETLASLQRIQAPSDQPTFETELAIVLFRRAPPGQPG
jgi:DNA-binding transcriptional ArsR family regulator